MFSGTLLTFIIVPSLLNYFSKILNSKTQKTSSSKLSDDEHVFLYSMSLMIEVSQDNFINLNILNYDAMGVSKLEIQETVSVLVTKGLIETSLFDLNLVSFTSIGRSKALKIKNSITQARRLR